MVSSTVQHLTLYGVPLQLYSQLAVWQVLPLSPFNKLENSGAALRLSFIVFLDMEEE